MRRIVRLASVFTFALLLLACEAAAGELQVGTDPAKRHVVAHTPFFDLEAADLSLLPLTLDGRPEGRVGFGRVTLRLGAPDGFALSAYPDYVRAWYERSFDAVVLRTPGGAVPSWLDLSPARTDGKPPHEPALSIEDVLVRTRSEVAWDPGERGGRPRRMPDGTEALFLLASDGTTWMYIRTESRVALIDCATDGVIRERRTVSRSELPLPESGRLRLEFAPVRSLVRASVDLRFPGGTRPIRLKINQRFKIEDLRVGEKPATVRDVTPESWRRWGSIMRIVEVATPGDGPAELSFHLEGTFPQGDPEGVGGFNEFYVHPDETQFPLTWLGPIDGNVQVTVVLPGGYSACAFSEGRDLRVLRGTADRESVHDLGRPRAYTDLRMVPGRLVPAGRVDVWPGRLPVAKLEAVAPLLDEATRCLEEYLGRPLGWRPILTYTRNGVLHQVGGIVSVNLDAARSIAEITPTIFHEAAHLYFGNRVRNNPDCGFLTEGLAEFLAYKTLVAAGRDAAAASFRERLFDQARCFVGLPLVAPAQRADSFVSHWRYYRGFALFDALERVLGEEGLRDALRLYLNERWGSTADAPKFAEVLSSARARATFGYWALTGLVPEAAVTLEPGKTGRLAFDPSSLPPNPLDVAVRMEFRSGTVTESVFRVRRDRTVLELEGDECPTSAEVIDGKCQPYLSADSLYRRESSAWFKACAKLTEQHDPRGALEYYRRFRPRTAPHIHDFYVGKCHSLLGQVVAARERLGAALESGRLPENLEQEAKALLEAR